MNIYIKRLIIIYLIEKFKVKWYTLLIEVISKLYLNYWYQMHHFINNSWYLNFNLLKIRKTLEGNFSDLVGFN